MQENNQIGEEQKQEEKKRRGNPSWEKGKSAWPAGRPKTARPPEQTNRSLREKHLLELVRKFRPLQTKAVQAAVKILDNAEAADANKIKASALVLTMYRDLIKEVYSKDYDEEENEDTQQDNGPIFSLRVLGSTDDDEKTGT